MKIIQINLKNYSKESILIIYLKKLTSIIINNVSQNKKNKT